MRVVVVGGGVIGLSVAWRCAADGMDVSLVDPAPGSGASWVAGGMLAPVAEAYRGEEALTALGLASVSRWPTFAADLADASGTDPGYTEQGTLVVARDPDDAAELHDLLAHQQAAGLAVEHVSSREARRLEPALAPSIRGALWLPADHQVDNRALLRALLEACTRTGVGLVPEPAARVRSSSVELRSGVTLDADAVVLATGAVAPPIEVGDVTHTVPVRPVKGQILRVRATSQAVFPTRTIRGIDVYVIPRANGEIAIGATSEEKGFDRTVTAGAVHELLRDAWELVPGLAEAEFVEAVAGLRPGTPDNAPMIGWWDGDPHPRPLLAMGHYRHGVLLAPVTADAVVALLHGSLDPGLAGVLQPFDPARFTAVAA
jgi:glycine oxidase